MMLGQILQEGLRLHQAGRLAEAELHYRQLLAQRPRDPDALHYLGLLAYQAQQYETAARLIGESIAEKADDPTAYSNLGNALAMLMRVAEAEAAFRGALSLDPEFADAWFNLGNILREQQRLTDADAAYRRVIDLRPNHIGAFNNLANLLLLRERKEEAAEAFDHLGDVLQDVGRTADATNAYRQAQDISPNLGLEVKLAFLTPVIPMSVAEIDRTRERLITGIAVLTAKGITLSDPLRYASSAIFYTGYHGRNDRDLRKGFADFYLGASPSLAWRAPHCASYAGAGERIKIGFISKFFQPEHPMTKLYSGIVEQLDRSRFDVSVFRFDPPGADRPLADTRVTVLSDDLHAARQAIGQARLDVLFYTDIGMEPTTYFLAFARLAPVQCVTFGHPVTTGIGTVDYFLSAQELDRADAQDHYTETLIRLATVPTFFKRPSPAAAPPTRTDLDLPVDARLYFCAQNLIKYHPDFDAILREILRRDPKGLLVLINSRKAPQLGQVLLARFQQSMPDVVHRIAFLPFLNLDALLGFLQYVDAILDTPVFGGGTTSLEMFAVDAPIVTWPGTFARSRITHALYRQMQVEGLAAENAAHYVELALRLANDPAWRAVLQGELRQKKHVLYENVAVVRELERFFTAAVGAAGAGRELQDWTG
jgi:predicted O-linked N-acetylglucosamine transferase (SPINDLY family)